MASANRPVEDSRPECHPIRKVVVVGGTHGNEYTGVWCIKALERRLLTPAKAWPSLDVETLLSHPEAYKQNKRFIDTDLNREFSEKKLTGGEGNCTTTVESLRARELDELLGPKFGDGDPKTDVIIDLHSTTTNMGISLIVQEGDVEMNRAAAYVSYKSGGEEGDARILMRTVPRKDLPGVVSLARHGFTVEVGPVPQGVLRHDAVEKTERAMYFLLEYLELLNNDRVGVDTKLKDWYPEGKVPVFETSGKIEWPSDPENPNFPQVMVHKSVQDRDFLKIKKGDSLFVDLDGNDIPYSGSHGEEVHLMFINEGGYYYSSSGTGIGVSVRREMRLSDGMFVN
eukprot:CAMPEP_0172500208 /NCGR_PEP_ID=MMETSP1066-20121228/135753_1 /TAXON_ID=671091 /ORGANISM="Coscinodiscus wailesii, Strain CCMP2513" /LENGTH=340 /DNA_ID=CAMNT_0013274325 /DNA_START=52 /DNA_END=1074 /DNA_ORIENTATION=-